MAIDLLSQKYWNGDIERQYRHELEAFIWTLPFAFLRYQNGEPQQGTVVDPWMTSDYIACKKEKSAFQNGDTLLEAKEQCQIDFKQHWALADALSNRLLAIDQLVRQAKSNGETNDSSGLTLIWPTFVEQLKLVAKHNSSLDYLNGLVNDRGLQSPIWARKYPAMDTSLEHLATRLITYVNKAFR